MQSSDTTQLAITQTKYWIERVIIAYGFCPFAKKVFESNKISYKVVTKSSAQSCLQAMVDECQYLDSNLQFETSFIIFTQAYIEFDDYLNGIAMAETLLEKQGYVGIYQIASFHPNYCFADQLSQDPENYTNRSPFPMMHIIRETSIDKALQTYSHPEAIPERNVSRARELGIDTLCNILNDCRRQ